MRLGRAWALLLLVQAAAAAPERSGGTAGEWLRGQPPPPGHYEAVLCVSVGQAVPNCGAVSASVGSAGQVLVRVSDIAYRLEVYADQLGVTLFHGTMQIDGFFAPYRWAGQQLQFNDTEKGTRYEVTLGARRFDAP